MAIFFEKFIDEFRINPTFKIYNKRIVNPNFKILKRIDLTFGSKELYNHVEYPYLEDIKALKQVLPVPEFLLKPLGKYNLPYEANATEKISFHGQKTVIYLHGVGGSTEENSILHRQLLDNGCDLIRISYYVDYDKENIYYPKKAEDMLTFIKEFEMKIGPAINEELRQVLSKLKDEYPDLFENKEIIMIAHSLGAGIIANLAASFKTIEFSKFINLDGTLLNPAIKLGLDISQLHLSQDSLFEVQWIDEEEFKEPLKAIGQDYCKRINTFISNSKNKKNWIQIKDSTHFTFTDFPNLLKPLKIFRKIAGDRLAAKRIRAYALEFILQSDILKVDSKDCFIRKTEA
jgi:hypothetical protein